MISGPLLNNRISEYVLSAYPNLYNRKKKIHLHLVYSIYHLKSFQGTGELSMDL